MTPCPKCNADAGKPRVGTLGEHKGYWCTACGHTAPTLDAWRGVEQTQRSVATSRNIGAMPWPLTPVPAPNQSPIQKLFHSRKHGPLQHSFPGLDLLPLVDVDAIPDDKLGVALYYLYGEVWTDASSAQQKRDRLRSLVT